MPGIEVVGRDEELDEIERFVADAQRGPAALVLAGEAGIGKTALWKAGIEMSEQRMLRVLACRGVEAEASLTFAGLSELLMPVLGETLERLPPPRRQALEVALLLADPGGAPPDAHAVGLAVLDVFEALVATDPLVVAIDDIQWLDASSSTVLQIAFRRIRDVPVRVLASMRRSGESSPTLDLEECFGDGRLHRLEVGPLSTADVHQLLKQRLGLELARPAVVRVYDATGGNPLFTVELGRELRRLGAGVRDDEPLPVPGDVMRLLAARIDRLSSSTCELLLAAALSAKPTIDLLAAVGGSRSRAIAAVDEAVDEGVIEYVGEAVRFAHPLYASALHEQATPERRRATHAALATVVVDVEERARHRALAALGPDRSVADELTAAARHAAARWAPTSAAALYELAVDLSPDESPSTRAWRLQAAKMHLSAGDSQRAVVLLEQLVDQSPPGAERADALFELAMASRLDPRKLAELSGQALAEVPDDDARSVRILANRTEAHLWAGDLEAALVDGRTVLATAEQLGDPELIVAATTRLAIVECYSNEVGPSLVARMERAIRLELASGIVPVYYENPRYGLSRVLMRTGDLDRARTLLEEFGAAATERGDERARAMVWSSLSLLEWVQGRWPLALEHAVAAHELIEQIHHGHGDANVRRAQALIETDLGLVDEARATCEAALSLARSTANEYFEINALGTLGRLELGLDDLVAAGDRLRDLPARLLAGRWLDPTLPVWADSIETLVAIGELDRAAEYQEHYQHQARRLDNPWSIASAERCRGALHARRGDIDAAVTALESSLAVLDTCDYPFERARALMSLGDVHRQAQRRGLAREALGASLVIFGELGARLWAAKAQAALGRISGRRPAAEELTETERRVAELAARGRSNKEIAGELFMGTSTVEAHLSRVYRKLGVRRRGELAAAFTTPQRSSGADAQTDG